ncbi:hypothetical protein U1Q18_019782 [Sarracenia purpurea var. burkii]
MPRSSRHKTHKQGKHSSRDARDDSESADDLKMKDRNGKEEGSVKVSRDSGSSEKRKLPSGKDPSGHGNGSTPEEYVASKRRKEKADVSAASDRWNAGGDERVDGATVVKEVKGESSRTDADKGSKSKALADSKSKSSRRHETGSENKEENVGLVAGKEESKSISRVDSKRKSEKDSGQKDVQKYKDSKDKERGSERERKIQETKRETEPTVGGEMAKKQGSHSVDFGEERQVKRGRENTVCSIQDELRNPELEKELEKRMRGRTDDSGDKDKYQDAVKESEDGRLSLRGDRVKEGRYKDEKYKDGSYGDQRRDDSGNRHRGGRYREDAERESRHRDIKHREDGDRDYRHRDNKYHEDVERYNRHKDDKYREDGVRDNRHKDDKYHEGGDRDIRHRGEKYREDGDRDNRHRDDKYREDGDRDYRHRGDKYREDGERGDRHRDDRFLGDGNTDSMNREEKNWDDAGRDSRGKVGMQRDDKDKDKRPRDFNYLDERSARDRTSDKPDAKHLRDGSNAPELHHRKINNRDGSPIVDDRNSGYKDDKGRRRTSDKEDHGEIRCRSTKEQHSDTEKKSLTSARVELVGDRGRSNSCNTDVEITPNHSRRRGSPSSSSHAVKDHYRLSKQEEPKYRDYVHDERIRHNVTSSKEYAGVAGVSEKASLSRSIEKPLRKDDNHLGEVSAERRPKEDTLPLQLVDKSPSSTNTDRRRLNRSDVRRSLDIDDSGQRNGGSRDAKGPSSREGRGSRELPMEIFPGDEISQVDGDNLSVSSPFSRTGHFSGNSRSLLPPPPPPFRMMGADSPLVLGSLEDDNRGKFNNRHRRIGDPSMGRAQGNAWRGVPNWPSPMANGFIPFQHGPPPVGFHPVMQQFPPPPMFSVRPSMELNQSGVPYQVPDGDRFSGHGRSLAWRNPVDDSCPPPIHGWDGNNASFGDEAHIYGRLNWDHNRNLTGGRVWETSGGAVWKGHNIGASTELPSAPQNDDYSIRGPGEDEVWPGQSGLQVQNEQKDPSAQVESIESDQTSDALEKNALEKNALETPKTIPEDVSKLSSKDADHLHLYLSMLDISPDLTQPELYSQYANLIGMDQNTHTEDDESKFLLVEEGIDAKVKTSNKTPSASLFSAVNDSIFQKAMSLYKKQIEVGPMNGEKVAFSNVENLESTATLDEKGAISNNKQGEVVPDCDQQEALGAASALTKVNMEVSPEIINDKIEDEPVLADSLVKSEVAIPALNNVKMELDPVSKQQVTLDSKVEDESSSPEDVERSNAQSPCKVEGVSGADDSKGNFSITNNEGQKSHDAKFGLLLFSDVSTEAVMPESFASGSVNLSRIHQSPESTH